MTQLPPCLRPVPYPSCPPCPRHPLLHIARLGRSRHKAVVSNYLSGRIVDCPAKKTASGNNRKWSIWVAPAAKVTTLSVSRANRPRGSSRLEVRFLSGDVTLRSSSEMNLSYKEITFNYIKKNSFGYKYQYNSLIHYTLGFSTDIFIIKYRQQPIKDQN